MPPTLDFYIYFFLTLFDHIWPFWTVLGARKKSVKSDLKKIWDPHRKDNRQWFEVKKWSPEFSKKVEKKVTFEFYVISWYDMIWHDIYDRYIWYMIYDMLWYHMSWYDMLCHDIFLARPRPGPGPGRGRALDRPRPGPRARPSKKEKIVKKVPLCL